MKNALKIIAQGVKVALDNLTNKINSKIKMVEDSIPIVPENLSEFNNDIACIIKLEYDKTFSGNDYGEYRYIPDKTHEEVLEAVLSGKHIYAYIPTIPTYCSMIYFDFNVMMFHTVLDNIDGWLYSATYTFYDDNYVYENVYQITGFEDYDEYTTVRSLIGHTHSYNDLTDKTHYMYDDMVTLLEDYFVGDNGASGFNVEIAEEYLIYGAQSKAIVTKSDSTVAEYDLVIMKKKDRANWYYFCDEQGHSMISHNTESKITYAFLGTDITLTLQVAKYAQLEDAYLSSNIARTVDIPTQQNSDWSNNDSETVNYVKNRPFYTYENTMLEFDGDYTDLPSMTIGTTVYYRIGDYIPYENVSDGSYYGITGLRFSNDDDEIVTKIDSTVIWKYMDSLMAMSIPNDNYDLTPFGYDGIVIEKSGFYTQAESSFTCGKLTKNIHIQLDEKYIPETIARVEDVKTLIKQYIEEALGGE